MQKLAVERKSDMSLRDVFNKTAGKRKASKKKAATAKKKPKTSVKSKGAKKKKAMLVQAIIYA